MRPGRWALLALAALMLASAGTANLVAGPKTDPRPVADRHLTVAAKATLPEGHVQPTDGPTSGQQDLAFTSRSVGFLLAMHGDTDRDQTWLIQRTIDGGRAWTTVWASSKIALTSITASGHNVLANGYLASSESAPPAPLLVDSVDTGTTWTQIVPSTPAPPPASPPSASYSLGDLRLQLITPTIGFALADPANPGGPSTAMLRTDDDGRTWQQITLPGGESTGGLAFVSPTRGFATGYPTSFDQTCRTGLWVTDNAGQTWSPVAGSCASAALYAISFPTPSTGFAVGGNPTKTSSPPDLYVFATTDGGAHWSTRYATGGPTTPEGPFGAVTFTSPTVGYALADACGDPGGSGPCRGPMWTTADGGHTWTRTDQDGFQLARQPGGDLWVVNDGTVLWHGIGDPQTFRPDAQAQNVGIRVLEASGSFLYADTNIGAYKNNNDGASWQPAGDPEPPSEPPKIITESGIAARIEPDNGSRLRVSPNAGRTGEIVDLGFGTDAPIQSVAFSGNRGLVTVAITVRTPDGADTRQLIRTAISDDRGQTWRPGASLPADASAVSLSGSTAVAYEPVGRSAPAQLLVSTNAGQSWRTEKAPSFCSAPQDGGSTTALLCEPNTPTYKLATSSDQGRKFSERRLVEPASNAHSGYLNIVAAGTNHLWAYDIYRTGLWESNDDGVHWAAVDPPFWGSSIRGLASFPSGSVGEG